MTPILLLLRDATKLEWENVPGGFMYRQTAIFKLADTGKWGCCGYVGDTPQGAFFAMRQEFLRTALEMAQMIGAEKTLLAQLSAAIQMKSEDKLS